MSAATFQVVSPRDGQVLATLPVMGPSEVEAAVGRARSAQADWAARTPGVRARLMRGVARLMGERADELAEAVVSETGKPRTEALAEVLVSVDLIRYYARVAPHYLMPRMVGTGWLLTKGARVVREPYGVVAGITPWNYPLILAMDCVTPALFAGNGVVLKPSEVTPLTSLLLPSLLSDAGIPDGLVQVVTGDGSTGGHLIRAGVDRLVFTGSTATGRKVMAAASEGLVPVTLELGGKDPAIVLEDANLERAARGVVFGAFFNAGQTCISVERVYVVRSVYESFVKRVTELAASLRAEPGGPSDIGPVIAPAQLGLIRDQLANALEGGARATVGGTDPKPGSRVLPPTVLVDVTDDMAVLRDETFGPVLPIVPVADEDEAVRRANDSEYGLFASVWTGSRERGLRVAHRLRAGGVSINDVLTHYGVPSLPMGGVAQSGFGRRRGLDALEEMSRPKTILSDRFGLDREPHWFPYSRTSERLMKAAIRWRARGGLAGVAGMVRTMMSKEE